MGADGSKSSRPQSAGNSSSRTDSSSPYAAQLRQCYGEITRSSQVDKVKCSRTMLEDYLAEKLDSCMAKVVGGQLCGDVSSKGSGANFTYQQFAQVILEYINGERWPQFLYSIVSETESNQTKESLKQTLAVVWKLYSYSMTVHFGDKLSRWRVLPADDGHLLVDYLTANVSEEQPVDARTIEKLLNEHTALAMMLTAVFKHAFQLTNVDCHQSSATTTGSATDEDDPLSDGGAPQSRSSDDELPSCSSESAAAGSALLCLSSLVLLAQAVSSRFARRWTLVYSSVAHGASFLTMAKRIDGRGPCLLLIKDNDGGVFGAYASHGFKTGHRFIGDDSCFVFQLAPAFQIFPASGYSQNYAYMNAHQETMPNGLGMGGSIDGASHFFALYISDSFNNGRSQANGTVFRNAQLSVKQNFEVDQIECWSVNPAQAIVTTKSDKPEQSCLDTDPEAKAMVAMSGRQFHSDGYRLEDEALEPTGFEAPLKQQ